MNGGAAVDVGAAMGENDQPQVQASHMNSGSLSQHLVCFMSLI